MTLHIQTHWNTPEEQEEFRKELAMGIALAVEKGCGRGHSGSSDIEDSIYVMSILEKWTDDEDASLDEDTMETILQEEIAKLK